MKRVILLMILLVGAVGAIYLSKEKNEVAEIVKVIEQPQPKEKIMLDVPLENQFSGEALGNGCEVTALSMLLRYYDYDINKNKLAAELDYQPLYTASGKHGNPHLGFVGEITGGDGTMGVAVEPIAKLAKKYVNEDYRVVASKKLSFNEMIKVIANGTPVWIIATVDFQVPTKHDFMQWETDQGTMRVTALIHSAVITGFDRSKKIVYVNDLHGYHNRKVSWTDLEKIYDQMDRQSLYLEKID